MADLTLDRASTIVDLALAHGRATECQPLTVAVLDPGGHLVALKRQDNSGILRVEIASGKAYGALGLGISSREIGGRGAPFLAALAAALFGALLSAGSLLIGWPNPREWWADLRPHRTGASFPPSSEWEGFIVGDMAAPEEILIDPRPAAGSGSDSGAGS